MKKIFFKNNSNKKRIPFWKPWGFFGWLWRFILFLLLLLILLFLLSLFRQCNINDDNNINKNDSTKNDTVRVVANDPDPEWNEPVENWNEIGLPAPEDNTLPPFEDIDPIPNPDNDGATEIYPNFLYVIFDSESNDSVYSIFAEKFAAKYPAPEHKIEYYNTGSKTAVLNVPENKRDQICESLPNDIPEVKFMVVPVEVMTQYDSVRPNDPAFSDENKTWYFNPIQAKEAWEITQGSSDIIVGIVDSYIDITHPELQGDRCIFPYSVIKKNSDIAPEAGTPRDFAGHGTLVTSIAVGNINNNQGASGIAPKCKFIPVSMGQEINTITQVEGLLYCMYHGASVINLSCGIKFPSEIISLPVNRQIQFSKEYGKAQQKMWDYVFKLAQKRNTTIVWASGNDNCYTAMDASKRNTNTIRVSAVDRNLKKADFSNFGNFSSKNLHESTISAPGVDIWGALPGNSYDAWPGTSFSAPIITGAVALIKSQNKDLTTAQIINILQSTGKSINSSPEIGKLVQIKDALIKAKELVSSASSPRNTRK